MNTQRWLAFFALGGLLAAVLTAPLWQPILQSSEVEDTPTPIPTFQATEVSAADSTLIPTLSGGDSMDMMMEEITPTPLDVVDPFVLAAGDFVTIDAFHIGEGHAAIYQAPDGTRFVRLDPFKVSEGPDLRVALAGHPAPRTPNELASGGGHVELGILANTEGAQTFDVPLSLRLEQFESVVIFSKEFNIIFTTATLESN